MEQPYTIQGAQAGPVLFVVAGIHGDEGGAVQVAEALLQELREHPLERGVLHLLPRANPEALAAHTRTLPKSGEDLNRAFPGSPTGSPAERMAQELLNTIVKSAPALLIDLHNDWSGSIPYCLLDHGAEPVQQRAHTVARALGCAVVREQTAHPQTLSGSVMERGIPALVIELGGSEKDYNTVPGLRLLHNALTALGMRGGAVESPHITSNESTHTALLYGEEQTKNGGVLTPLVAPGSMVRVGDALAEVVSGDKKERVSATGEALVLGFNDAPSLAPGDAVVALGVIE